MLSEECCDAYWEQYGRGTCHFEAPAGKMTMVINGKHYAQPRGETDAAFMDRLRRSRAAGRNLFAEEWPEYVPYDLDAWNPDDPIP